MGKDECVTRLAGTLEWVRSQGPAHEMEWPGHRTTLLDISTHGEAALRMICNVCRWTVSAGGPREEDPAMTLRLAEVERERDAALDLLGSFERRLAVARERRDAAEARLTAAREYVDDPGNWSAMDGRRGELLRLLGTAHAGG